MSKEHVFSEYRAVWREDKNSAWYVVKVTYSYVDMSSAADWPLAGVIAPKVSWESYGEFDTKADAIRFCQGMDEMCGYLK